MARSDLLTALVKAGTAGDKRGVQTVVEAMVAEERAKQHHVLADRLMQAAKSNGNGAHPAGPTFGQNDRGRDLVAEIIPRRRLEDLVLPESVRLVVNQFVEEQQRADLLRANGLEPRHRILFVGPPGTGKTSLAEAIAEAVMVPLLVVRYEAVIGSYLGETGGRLKRVFDYARTTPCVLFFDEFDSIAKERGDIHETGEIKRVVSTLLMQVDDLPSYTIVAAATNHPELLDRASWRRFQVRVTLPTPDVKALASYVDAFAQRMEGRLGQSSLSIAKALGPISYAEAEQFCLDVQRRHILSLGTNPLRSTLCEQLAIWTARREEASISGRETTGVGATVDRPSVDPELQTCV